MNNNYQSITSNNIYASNISLKIVKPAGMTAFHPSLFSDLETVSNNPIPAVSGVVSVTSSLVPSQVTSGEKSTRRTTSDEAKETVLLKTLGYTVPKLEPDLFDKIVSMDNLNEALKFLKNKYETKLREGKEYAGEYLAIYEEYGKSEEKRHTLLNKLKEGKYNAKPPKTFSRPKESGDGRRECNLFEPEDSLVHRMILQVVQSSDLYESAWCPESFAYRKGLGADAAVIRAKDHVENGFRTVLKTDISHYFDSIPRKTLQVKIIEHIGDARLANLINDLLWPRPLFPLLGGKDCGNRKGVPQGSILGGWIAGLLYLDELDRYMEAKGYRFIRYCDDIAVFTKDKDAATKAKEDILDFLKVRLGLQFSKEKTTISSVETVKLCGFIWKDGDWLQEKEQRRPCSHADRNSVRHRWKRPSLNENSGSVKITPLAPMTKEQFPVQHEEAVQMVSEHIGPNDHTERFSGMMQVVRKFGCDAGTLCTIAAEAHRRAGESPPPNLLSECKRAVDFAHGSHSKHPGPALKDRAPTLEKILECEKQITPDGNEYAYLAYLQEALSYMPSQDNQPKEFTKWLSSRDSKDEVRYIGPKYEKRAPGHYLTKGGLKHGTLKKSMKQKKLEPVSVSINAIPKTKRPKKDDTKKDGTGLLKANCKSIKWNMLEFELPKELKDEADNYLEQNRLKPEIHPILKRYVDDDLRPCEIWYLNFLLKLVAYLIVQLRWSQVCVTYSGHQSLHVVYAVHGLENLPVIDCAEHFNYLSAVWLSPIGCDVNATGPLQCTRVPGVTIIEDGRKRNQGLVAWLGGQTMEAGKIWNDLWRLGGGDENIGPDWQRMCKADSNMWPRSIEEQCDHLVKSNMGLFQSLDAHDPVKLREVIDYLHQEVRSQRSTTEMDDDEIRTHLFEAYRKYRSDYEIDTTRTMNTELETEYDISEFDEARRCLTDLVKADLADSKFDGVLQLFKRAYKHELDDHGSGGSYIMALPCGSGKTLMSYVFLAAKAKERKRDNTASESSEPRGPFIFAVETIKKAHETAELFRRAGIKAEAMTSSTGLERCCQNQTVLALNRYKACRKCKRSHCGCRIKHIIGWREAFVKNDIIVITHVALKQILGAAALAASNKPSLQTFIATRMPKPSDTELIVVDETPSLFTELEITASDMASVAEVLKDTEEAKDNFVRDMAVIEERCRECGTAAMTVGKSLGGEWVDAVCLELAKRYRNEAETFTAEDEHTLEVCMELAGFLHRATKIIMWSDKELHGELTKPSRRDPTSVKLMCGLTDNSLSPGNIWVLDATAELVTTPWLNAPILKAPELERNYSDTVIHALPCASTKTRLAKDSTLEYVSKEVASGFLIPKARTCVCVNKQGGTDSKILDGILDLLSKPVEEGGLGIERADIVIVERGEHKGTNKAHDCVNMIIVMSTFSSIADIAMRTGLTCKRAVTQDDLFQVIDSKDEEGGTTRRRTPKLSKAGELDDRDCNYLMQRMMAIEMVQALLRPCIRSNANATCRIVAVGIPPALTGFIRMLLPGAHIELEGEQLLQEFVIGNKSYDALAEEYGISRDSIRDRLERLGRYLADVTRYYHEQHDGHCVTEDANGLKQGGDVSSDTQ